MIPTPGNGTLSAADVCALEPGDTFYRKRYDHVLRCVVQPDGSVASYRRADDKYPVTTNPLAYFVELLSREEPLLRPTLFSDEASAQASLDAVLRARADAIRAQSKEETLDVLFREWYGEDGHHPDIVTAMQDRLESLFGVRPER